MRHDDDGDDNDDDDDDDAITYNLAYFKPYQCAFVS